MFVFVFVCVCMCVTLKGFPESWSSKSGVGFVSWLIVASPLPVCTDVLASTKVKTGFFCLWG